ncbi:NTP transferase domain-containing protein [Candidatus Woesearchaeota archaeon]|nr:NTP transferase domain-containing protein [Candidatus Woesearchaeota archaeon]
MKAVILAAGKSTRLHPLTLSKPKVMLPVANTPILEHNLQQLLETRLVDEAVIVVGFCSGQIMAKFGSKYGKIRLEYAFQTEQLGTGHALLQAEKFVVKEEKFLALMGDDLYSGSDIKKCLRHSSSILAKKVQNIGSFGKIVSEKGILKGLVEKPDENGSGLANAGCYVLPGSIFQLLKKARKSSRGEIELTDAVVELAKTQKVAVEGAEFWQPITYPWSLLDANEAILKQREKDKPQISAAATVEKGATLKGYVEIGKNTLIRNGACIEGPVVIGNNCTIGPNCYIRAYTAIGNNCRIGNAVEVKNSMLMDNATIGHLSYCGDSVIGESVNFGAGTIIANLRHDDGNVKSMAKGELVDTGRRKFGAIIGDNAKTGINTSIYPGRKIWPGKTTLPGEVVKKDVV